jgi:HAD superfamily hydrolase (TIGR01458 family)
MDGEPLTDLDGLLVDIDGVLTVSWTAVPGAATGLDRLRAAGVPLRFVTNTTSASRAEIVERLGAAGFGVAVDEVLTAPAATAAWLAQHHPGARCHLLTSGDPTADLAGVRLVAPDEPAEVVVLGGAGPEFGYDALNRALALLLDGAALVAMHANRYWRTAAGLQLDTGAYVAALERAAGVEAVVVGKPSPALFATGVAELAVAPERCAMVGDDLESDVLAAQRAGLHGVLVRTGKFRADALDAALPDRPDRVVDDFGAVPDLLGVA